MNKIVPFKKEITFKTSLAEVTSISLEQDLKCENNTVTGNLIVSGEYKITQASINIEPFNFELPFEISLDDKYDTDNLKIDIDDFYYEVINNSILEVSIDILLDNLKEKEVIVNKIEEVKKEREEIKLMETIKKVEAPIQKEQAEEPKYEMDEVRNSEEIENVRSLFDNFDDSKEDFVSYKVYILREGDSIESIMTKYSITRENLEEYNNLTEVKIGDKIIIPSIIHATN